VRHVATERRSGVDRRGTLGQRAENAEATKMIGAARAGNPRGLTWPDKSRWYAYLRFMLVFYALFLPVYFGTQYLAFPSRPGLQLFFE
jgi:hypothetical protein